MALRSLIAIQADGGVEVAFVRIFLPDQDVAMSVMSVPAIITAQAAAGDAVGSTAMLQALVAASAGEMQGAVKMAFFRELVSGASRGLVTAVTRSGPDGSATVKVSWVRDRAELQGAPKRLRAWPPSPPSPRPIVTLVPSEGGAGAEGVASRAAAATPARGGESASESRAVAGGDSLSEGSSAEGVRRSLRLTFPPPPPTPLPP
jgi:hypothetical protein